MLWDFLSRGYLKRFPLGAFWEVFMASSWLKAYGIHPRSYWGIWNLALLPAGRHWQVGTRAHPHQVTSFCYNQSSSRMTNFELWVYWVMIINKSFHRYLLTNFVSSQVFRYLCLFPCVCWSVVSFRFYALSVVFYVNRIDVVSSFAKSTDLSMSCKN